MNNNKDKGFTLMELLVAMAAFSLIIITMTGIAQSVIKA
jgi:prepilin-type N-terminal cleavage/methylation domain-containing protein